MSVGRSDERGFGVIEVLIAMLVMMVVASAIAMATLGGTKLRGAARLQEAMTGVAQRVQEDVSTDRGWMRSCTTIDAPCTIDRRFVDDDTLELEDVAGRATLQYLRSIPLDSAVDGKTPNDSDGLIPDYYRIEFELRPHADVAQRYGTTPERAKRLVVTTIDRRGEQAHGSLAIEVCRILNQSDERMSIQGCAPRGSSSIRMAACAPTATACHPVFGWVANRAASDTEPSPFVTMRRIPANSLNIVVRHDGTGWSANAASAKMDAAGRLTFENVPAGTVRIQGLPASVGDNSERWRSKELPGYLGTTAEPGSPVVVEPGVRARALALYRPAKTRAGVNLRFQRRTRTLRLTGPHSGHNLVVPKWAPTHSYEGEWAERICEVYDSDYSGGFGDISLWARCEGVKNGVPRKNCATVYKSGQYGYTDPNGPIYVDEEMGVYRYMSELEDPSAIEPARRRSIGTAYNVRIATLCTEYWQEYFTTYYRGEYVSERIRQGAAQPVTYSIQPMPENRYVEKRGNTTHTVVSQCVIPARSQCTTSAAAPQGLNRLIPGLNSGMKPSYGDYEHANDLSPARADRINTQRGVSPAAAWNTLRGGALWVRPNGDLVGSDGGTVPAGTTITATGEGECYWLGPHLRSETEGACNPCQPLWKPGWEFRNACSVLTNVRWARHVRELRYYFDFPSGEWENRPPREGDLPSKQDDIPVLQACLDRAPIVIGRCRTVPRQPPPIDVPKTRHTGQGGTAEINSHKVNTGPPET